MATKEKVARTRTVNLVLFRKLTTEELGELPGVGTDDADGMFKVLADESCEIRDEKDVEKWMEANEFEGELYVGSFRRGTGKREGEKGRLRRRRFKPAEFVVE